MKAALSLFMECSRVDKTMRNFTWELQMMNSEFAKRVRGTSLSKLNMRSTFGRSSTETLRTFWTRYIKTANSPHRSGAVLPKEVRYNKAIARMKLPSGKISALLGTLQVRDMDDSSGELERILVKLSESNFLVPTEAIIQVIGGAENAAPSIGQMPEGE